MITELLVQLNKKVGYSDNKFHLRQISSKLIPAKGSNYINTSVSTYIYIYDIMSINYLSYKQSLDLLNPQRKLIMRGKMKRFIHHQYHSTIDQTHDMQVFLFDNYLFICKVKIQDGLEYYKPYQKVRLLDAWQKRTYWNR